MVHSIGFTFITIWDINRIKSDIQTGLALNTKLVANNCVVPLTFGDDQQATEALSHLKNIEFIETACLFDKHGNLFASYPDTLNRNIKLGFQEQQDIVFKDGFFYVKELVSYQNKTYGTLFVKANSQPLKIAKTNIIVTLVLLSIVLDILVIVLAIKMQRYISLPIIKLKNHFDEIAEYQDFSVRLEKQNNDEIGSLYDGFNNMLIHINKGQEELHESEAKLNALFSSLTEMVILHDIVLNSAGKAIDYRIIDCNKVFTKITGISKENAIGKLASQIYETNPPPYLDKFAMVALGGDSYEFTTFNSVLDKHLMISVISPQAGKFATITTDITAMMQIQEMIVAKNKEMENYLYVASHDLRTPLVNIQGFSQRLKKQADSIKNLFTNKTLEPEILSQLGIITDEDIPKTLSFVLSNIEKMDILINGLLQLSRTGTVEMNIQEIDMNALFAKIIKGLDFQIKESQCKIHLDFLPECYGDAALLDQLFENIISNALKYSDSKRTLEITVSAKHTHKRVVYAIRDTGKGIAQKHLDKIWDVFYRVDPRSSITGEGIGLSLVKRIVEKHKGKVWAESEENKGSVFYIELNNCNFTKI